VLMMAVLTVALPVMAQQSLVQNRVSEVQALERVRGDVVMIGDRFPGAVLQRGIL
jgi:hypothetical protein